MQIYTDQHGVQRFTEGQLSIDIDSGEATFEVAWDFVSHGGEIDPAKVGGYLNSTLDWSQEAFDANEALKIQVAANAAALTITQAKQTAIALISNSTGQPVTEIQKAFAKATAHFLGIAEEVFIAKVLEFLQTSPVEQGQSSLKLDSGK
jgi:hypothetical protein